jgi:hypothetical protein
MFDHGSQYTTRITASGMLLLSLNSALLHNASLVKYAAAFFMISVSPSRLTISVPRQLNSIFFSVTTQPLAPPSLSSVATLAQRCSGKRMSVSSRSTAWTIQQYITLRNALSACRGMFFICLLPIKKEG